MTKTEALIDRRIVPVIRKQRLDPGNLAGAFRKMRLHQRIGIGFQQFAAQTFNCASVEVIAKRGVTA